MTNEEAILMLERIMYDEDNHGIEWAAGAKQTFEMAISALQALDGIYAYIMKSEAKALDTISRTAAIEAVEKESQVDGAYGYMDTKSIVDLLNDLPSAQPEAQ